MFVIFFLTLALAIISTGITQTSLRPLASSLKMTIEHVDPQALHSSAEEKMHELTTEEAEFPFLQNCTEESREYFLQIITNGSATLSEMQEKLRWAEKLGAEVKASFEEYLKQFQECLENIQEAIEESSALTTSQKEALQKMREIIEQTIESAKQPGEQADASFEDSDCSEDE